MTVSETRMDQGRYTEFRILPTNPIINIFRWVTPGFLIEPVVPLFVAWFFFAIRFYVMPWLLGYLVMGMLSFPLEGEIAGALYQIFNQ